MKLINRMILKEIESNRKTKITTDFTDLLFKLNVSEKYLQENIDELVWYGYLILMNNKYRVTKKGYDYLNNF